MTLSAVRTAWALPVSSVIITIRGAVAVSTSGVTHPGAGAVLARAGSATATRAMSAIACGADYSWPRAAAILISAWARVAKARIYHALARYMPAIRAVVAEDNTATKIHLPGTATLMQGMAA